MQNLTWHEFSKEWEVVLMQIGKWSGKLCALWETQDEGDQEEVAS